MFRKQLRRSKKIASFAGYYAQDAQRLNIKT